MNVQMRRLGTAVVNTGDFFERFSKNSYFSKMEKLNLKRLKLNLKIEKFDTDTDTFHI